MRDRYKIVVGPQNAKALIASMKHSPNNTPLYSLVWLCIEGFVNKLTLFALHDRVQKPKAFTLNKREALAFHIGYKQGYFFKEV